MQHNCFMTDLFPAGAGVIRLHEAIRIEHKSVPRRRGGDPKFKT